MGILTKVEEEDEGEETQEISRKPSYAMDPNTWSPFLANQLAAGLKGKSSDASSDTVLSNEEKNNLEESKERKRQKEEREQLIKVHTWLVCVRNENI